MEKKSCFSSNNILSSSVLLLSVSVLERNNPGSGGSVTALLVMMMKQLCSMMKVTDKDNDCTAKWRICSSSAEKKTFKRISDFLKNYQDCFQCN